MLAHADEVLLPVNCTCKCHVRERSTYIIGTSDQLLAGIIYLTDHIGFVEVPVVTFVVRCHVNIHNVTIFQGALVWYPMTDDLNSKACMVDDMSHLYRGQTRQTSHDDVPFACQGYHTLRFPLCAHCHLLIEAGMWVTSMTHHAWGFVHFLVGL